MNIDINTYLNEELSELSFVDFFVGTIAKNQNN